MSVTSVVTMANDAVYDAFCVLAQSLREQDPDITFRVVPFDDTITRISKLREIFNFDFIEADFTAVDRARADLFPNVPYSARLRILAAFPANSGCVFYIDADTLLIRSVADLFIEFKKSDADIGFFAHSWEHVYRVDYKVEPRLRQGAVAKVVGIR